MRGTSFSGDIALDDINITPGTCPSPSKYILFDTVIISSYDLVAKYTVRIVVKSRLFVKFRPLVEFLYTS